MSDRARLDWETGERIELVRMPDDPDPIEAGTKGTITWVNHLGDHTQLSVRWDNGRGLGVVIPPDEIRRVPPSRDWQPPDVTAADQERGL